MKNLLVATVVVCISAIGGTNGVNAQTQASSGFNKNDMEKITAPVNDYLFGGDEINAKAQKNFAHTYKNINTEKWMKIKNGYCASFASESKKNIVFYDRKGKWVGSVATYTEESLPRDVRRIVRSEYYDYSIFFVEEVETIDSGGVPTYLVHLEDKSTIKLVLVTNGEITPWKDYVKG